MFIRQAKKIIQTKFGYGRVRSINNPCESVDLDRGLMFIAIPKTGSSSVRQTLRGKGDYLIPQEHLNFRESRDALMAYLIKTRLSKNEKFPSDCVPSYQEIKDECAYIIENVVKFSVVRNPWARTVSMYYRREGLKLSGSISFNEFVDRLMYASDTCVHPSRHQNQVDWLIDDNGKIAMDFVEKLENLHSNIKCLEGKLKFKCEISSKKLNVNPNSKSDSYRDLYSETTKKKVSEIFEKDIDTFKYTFD